MPRTREIATATAEELRNLRDSLLICLDQIHNRQDQLGREVALELEGMAHDLRIKLGRIQEMLNDEMRGRLEVK